MPLSDQQLRELISEFIQRPRHEKVRMEVRNLFVMHPDTLTLFLGSTQRVPFTTTWQHAAGTVGTLASTVELKPKMNFTCARQLIRKDMLDHGIAATIEKLAEQALG